jgi:hypothetical protein
MDNDDINAPVDMNTMPMTVPFRVWNITGVKDYPPPRLRDKTGVIYLPAKLWAALMHPH